MQGAFLGRKVQEPSSAGGKGPVSVYGSRRSKPHSRRPLRNPGGIGAHFHPGAHTSLCTVPRQPGRARQNRSEDGDMRRPRYRERRRQSQRADGPLGTIHRNHGRQEFRSTVSFLRLPGVGGLDRPGHTGGQAGPHTRRRTADS